MAVAAMQPFGGVRAPADPAEDSDGSDLVSEEDLESKQREEDYVVGFSHSMNGARRNSVSSMPVTETMIQNWQGAPVYEKTPEEMARIKAVIEESSALQVMFGHLKGREIDSVVGAMFARDVEVGATVIEQGADGDYFYIVDSGTYHIFVRRQGTLPDAQPEWVQTAGPGASFGELALMYNVARAATVRCAEPGRLWCLDRDCFQMMLVTTNSHTVEEYHNFLSQVEVLRSLTRFEIGRLAEFIESNGESFFEDGEEIITQGEEGDSVYFLYEGQCAAYIRGEHGEVEVLRYTTPGQYFGEVSLVYSEPRRATVRACGECTCLHLKKTDVNLSIGDLRARLEANIETYRPYEAMLQTGAEP